MGPVVPLLAIAESFREHDPSVEFIWIGTKNGPEKNFVEVHGIKYVSIGSGKWRRYFSIWNFFDIFRIVTAFFQALFFLIKEKPNLLISAGGYVSVPIHWAGGLLGMPSWVHQQDVQIGLANKLMFRSADKITTALEETAKKIKGHDVEWIGNPSRNLTVPDLSVSRKKFSIPENSPVIFALGGGTGSQSVNELIVAAVPQLNPNCHVIHLVGKNRPSDLAVRASVVFPNYHVFTFFNEEMKDAYAIADVVIARAGFSTLTELAALRKASMILPMFDTHQEENARYFAKGGGIILLEKNDANGLKAAATAKQLIDSPEKRAELGNKLNQMLPKTSSKKITSIIDSLTKIK